MADAIVTPDERFAGLPGYGFKPRFLAYENLRLHYVEEGTGPPVLLLHGEPTWSYMYRDVIGPLVEAGYRCLAPDYIGFGRSDKVVDDQWYTIEQHCRTIRHLIETLDLRDITLVVHDWGGPIGLRQAVDMPERFARLVILNTWLHHDGFEYTETIRTWRNLALTLHDLPAGRIVAGTFSGGPEVERAYDAPFTGPESKAGIRRLPWCLPFAEPEAGNAQDQQRCFDALTTWDKPCHLIFGADDTIFPVEWARKWADHIPGATLDLIEGARHFVAEERGGEIAAIMLGYMRD